MPERTIRVLLDPARAEETMRVLGTWHGVGLWVGVRESYGTSILWEPGRTAQTALSLPPPEASGQPLGFIAAWVRGDSFHLEAPLPVCSEEVLLAFMRGLGGEVLGLLNGVAWLALADARTDWRLISPEISVLWVHGVDRLGDLSRLARVAHAQIRDCRRLASIAPIAALRNVTSFSLSRWEALTDLSPLKALPVLESLTLSDCEVVTDLSALPSLTNLRSLSISRCKALTELSGLRGFTALHMLSLSRCDALADLSPLRTLTGLHTLNLSQCGALADLSPLQGLTGLQTLGLSQCGALADLSPLQGLTGLRALYLCQCTALTEVSGLRGLLGLQSLDLSCCQSLGDLSGLRGLIALQSLNLSYCGSLTDLSGLQGLPALQSLRLCGCCALTDLSGLKDLGGLRWLTLSGCTTLAHVAGLQALTGLESLNLSRCGALTDLSGLQGLANLEYLDLGGCERLTDLSALQGLANLEYLDLGGCERLTDLSALQGLTCLKVLRLFGCSALTELPRLQSLAALRSLDLSLCSGLRDLSALRSLTVLRSLCLCCCGELPDVSIVRELTALESLDLSGSKALTDLSGLQSLTALESLDLSASRALIELSPLQGLTALQTLNLAMCSALTNLSGLRGLTSLESLDLSRCERLTDLSALGSLLSLRSLKLSDCLALSDLSGLRGLTGLQSLDLSKCLALAGLSVLENLTGLTELRISGNGQRFPLSLLTTLGELQADGRFANLPSEVLLGLDKGCLPAVRAHVADLQGGEAEDRELKVMVLGNGAVGKTSLLRRLCGEDFDLKEPSTHGVRLLRQEFAMEGGKPVSLNIWDFGGQDLYLGTHALFAKGRCIYLLVWDQEHENEEETRDRIGSRSVRNHRRRYWLDYIQSQSPGAPVIVIQNKCPAPVSNPLTDGERPNGIGYHEVHWFCAETNANLPGIQTAIANAIAAAWRSGWDGKVGKGRLHVKAAIRKLVPAGFKARKKGPRIIEMADYAALCDQAVAAGHTISEYPELLKYLHHSGVVFYDRRLLADHIIVDQRWACDAIYSLFRRDDHIWALFTAANGQFTPATLRLAWERAKQVDPQAPTYSEGEQKLILQFMLSCGVCFRLSHEKDEPTYVVPDYLRNEPDADLAARWGKWPQTWGYRYEYGFLHDGDLRQVLAEVGNEVQTRAAYHRWGIYVQPDPTFDLRVSAELGQGDSRAAGRIFVQVGSQGRPPAAAVELLRTLDRLVRRIREPAEAVLEPPELAAYLGERRDAKGSRGERAEVATGEPVAVREPSLAEQTAGANVYTPVIPEWRGKTPVYISYPWAADKVDNMGREGEATHLYNTLKRYGYDVRRDKEQVTDFKAKLLAFMEELAQGDAVVVILCDAYLKSPNTVGELLGIYDNSRNDDHFWDRIFPLRFDDVKVFALKDQMAYQRHWDATKAGYTAEEQEKARAADNWEFKTIERAASGDLLKVLSRFSERNLPMSRELAKNDFAEPRESLDAWLKKLHQGGGRP